eukprot:TRINITY_DN65067_c0_g1_i1.p1 TRINITY_DN65067_c0_g1~~TRINITY_DN65067_c0_g1_i1.p1  ORF type:complete len:328 (-),score=87.12 TRINITY_DN65067_c0_g1_i1:29-1012(-)
MAHIFDVSKYSKGMENAGADGRKDSSEGPGGIYHEKQIPNLCGLHAVNNLLQGRYFERHEFDRVAQQLDNQERSMGLSLPPGEGNYRPDGFYNVTVLEMTLQSRGFVMQRVQSGDWKKDAEKHAGEEGFIFNKEEHWFCYRRIHEEWFLINSTQHRPVHFLARELGSAVNFAVQDGFGVFTVRGSFPKCSLEGNQPKLEEAVKGSGGSGPVIIKFGGSGHTLGGGGGSAPVSAAGGAIAASAGAMELVVDASKPKTKIQLQFPDGSKKAEEFNTDHTVGDLRGVCSKAVGGKPVKVKGGFPPKSLEDDAQSIEDAGLKGARVTVEFA